MDTQTLLNVLTAVLAVATVWLAIATQLMARATKQALELEATPYLTFAGPHIVVGKMPLTVPDAERASTVRLGLGLRNPGKVRVQYEISTIRMTLNALTIENPTFTSHGSYIFPGETGVFWYGTLQVNGDLIVPSQGTAEFEVLYWAADSKRKSKLSQRLTYSLLSVEPPYVDWVNSREIHST
jgi:hypothetical protein